MAKDYQIVLREKYEGISQRSFKTRLELFLFSKIINDGYHINFTNDEFFNFVITDNLVEIYEKSWQLQLDEKFKHNGNDYRIDQIDLAIIKWCEVNKDRKVLMANQYKQFFKTKVLTLEEFAQVFKEDSKERICHYTQLSDDFFEELRKFGIIKTKNSRGRYMEIDRLNSNKEYELGNIVLACYWANNAKMDEFTQPEFSQYVGPAMREVFLKRR